MKRILLVLCALTISFGGYSQDISGQWNGLLKEMKLRLVVHITETDIGYGSTLDSPDQGAKGIPVTETTFKNDTLKTTVEGLEFKKALFGIWLSEDAVQDDLKEGLLGSI